jgi:Putative Flp pilus-assembly TadE/G-like
MNKRGSIPLIVAGMLPVALVAGSFAINAVNTWVKQARFQTALDAAALAAARDFNSPNRDANTRAMLAANMGGTTVENVSIVPSADGNSVEVKASITVNPLVNTIISPITPTHTFGPKQILRSATANRNNTGMELALVFDITLSMVASDGSDGENNRVESARDAAKIMLGKLYDDLPPLANGSPNPNNKKWLKDLFISVVPFNVTVNYGAANTHFLSATPPASGSSEYPASWTGNSTSWGGCAEMRSTSLNDATPSGSSSGLRRYYWPSTYDTSAKYNPNLNNNSSAQPYCLSNAAYVDGRNGNPSGANRVCMGHNDWTAPAYVLSGTGSNGAGGKQNTLIAAFSSNSLVSAAGLNAWATAHGPNMMCPPDTGSRTNNLTVLPLTRDRATIEARINALANLPFSYGTNIAAGLQAGWFTLSPNWRAKSGFAGWPSAEPAPVAGDSRPTLPSLPLDYYAENMKKVMIVLTDGDNLWMSARDVQGNGNTLVRPESRQTQGFYGSYGYLGSDYVGDDRFTATSTSSASDKIDVEAEAWCAKIKEKIAPSTSEKITIITIGFGSSISSAATTVLTNCASVDQTGKRLYYPAPTAAVLLQIFTAIGNDLTRLRLSQ